MKKWILFLGFIAALIIVLTINDSEIKQAKTIFVDSNGNDSNNGSKLSPYRTLKKAALEAEAGSTVFIRKGIYKEKLSVIHSGTKSHPIIFKA